MSDRDELITNGLQRFFEFGSIQKQKRLSVIENVCNLGAGESKIDGCNDKADFNSSKISFGEVTAVVKKNRDSITFIQTGHQQLIGLFAHQRLYKTIGPLAR